MKKLRVAAVILLCISSIAFVGFRFMEKIRYDKEAPVISFEQDACTVSVKSTEEEMLLGVHAQDERSGDVSDTLVVEGISAFTGENTRVISYAASDESGNVGRAERTLSYTDYEKPRFSLQRSLRFPTGELKTVLPFIYASSTLDGDLSSKIKFTLSDRVNINSLGKYPIEFSVMDSGGNTVYLPTVLEIYDSQVEQINVTLNKYIVYIEKDSSFDPDKYYAGSDPEGNLEIMSNVNTSVPGVYHVDYLVTGDHTLGKNRLVVVVEG